MTQRHVDFDNQSNEGPDKLVQRLPLYLHTVLSVLRKMGPKDFCYEGAYSFLSYAEVIDPIHKCRLSEEGHEPQI